MNLFQHEALGKITVVRDYDVVPKILCYPNQLNQVFFSLFVNASQAMTGQGTITVKTYTEDDMACIRISDTGRGISPQNLHRIFDPGFTTKGVGVGTGLGLSISYNIIRKHGGVIKVASVPARGTEFTIKLPIRRSS